MESFKSQGIFSNLMIYTALQREHLSKQESEWVTKELTMWVLGVFAQFGIIKAKQELRNDCEEQNTFIQLENRWLQTP